MTPAQGVRKQPGRQTPSTQVWLEGHATPAHGSLVETQVALQLPPLQPISFAPVHGSPWQVPPRQTCPAAHGVGHPGSPPPVVLPVPVPVPAPVPVPFVPAAPVVEPPAPAVPAGACPAIPLGVPFVPAAPAGVPMFPPAPGPPGLPDAPEPQPDAARSDTSPSPSAAQSAAAPIDRGSRGPQVIVPPDTSVAGTQRRVR